MQILVVKFQSELSDREVRRCLEGRLPTIRAFPGLLQKYCTWEPLTGSHMGIHLFDSEESLKRYRSSEFASSLPTVYRVTGTPRVEVLDVVHVMRSESAVANP